MPCVSTFEFQPEALSHSLFSKNLDRGARRIEFISEKWKAENDSLNSLKR